MSSRPRAVGLSLVGLLAMCVVWGSSAARARPLPKVVVGAPTTLEVMELASIYQEIVAVRSELRKKRVALALLDEKEKELAEARWLMPSRPMRKVRAKAPRRKRLEANRAPQREQAEEYKAIVSGRGREEFMEAFLGSKNLAILQRALAGERNKLPAQRIVLEERIAYLVRLEAALLADAAPLKAKVGPVKGPIKLIPLPSGAPAERKKGP